MHIFLFCFKMIQNLVREHYKFRDFLMEEDNESFLVHRFQL